MVIKATNMCNVIIFMNEQMRDSESADVIFVASHKHHMEWSLS